MMMMEVMLHLMMMIDVNATPDELMSKEASPRFKKEEEENENKRKRK